MQIGSSPPAAAEEVAAAGSSVASSFVDADDHTQRSATTEDWTAQFVGSLVRTIINHLPLPPPTWYEPVVEYRFARQSWKARLGGWGTLRAIDDGGLDLRFASSRSSGFLRTTSSVALVEAKPRMSEIQDGRPVMSDRLLAQLTGEALVSRLSQQDNPEGILALEQYLHSLYLPPYPPNVAHPIDANFETKRCHPRRSQTVRHALRLLHLRLIRR